MEETDSKTPFDGWPVIVGLCLIPICILWLKTWRHSVGRIYVSTGAILLPASILAITHADAGSWLIAFGYLSLFVFGLPLCLLLVFGFYVIIISVAPLALLLSGLGLFGYEAYYFLRHGTWNLHTFLDFAAFDHWLDDRRDWVGLKKILKLIFSYLPLWLMLLVASGIATTITDSLEQNYQEQRREYLKLRGSGISG